MYVITLSILLLGVVTVTSGVWLTGSFSHGDPSFDQGCYCHNNGIAIFVNGTGDGNGGLFLGSFNAGTSLHLYISTNNVAATGVIPGLQQWMSNQTDNAKFTITPTQVNDGSAQDKSPTVGNITALYKVSIPASLASGSYTLTLYAQGGLTQPLMIQVTGTSTTSTTHHHVHNLHHVHDFNNTLDHLHHLDHVNHLHDLHDLHDYYLNNFNNFRNLHDLNNPDDHHLDHVNHLHDPVGRAILHQSVLRRVASGCTGVHYLRDDLSDSDSPGQCQHHGATAGIFGGDGLLYPGRYRFWHLHLHHARG